MSTAQPDLAELDVPELEAALEARGGERFHARQLYRWIYKRGVVDFERMTDLSKELRARLAAEFQLTTPAVVSDSRSIDGTRKFVLELADRRRIEAVFIPDTPAMTFCISTQVGCAMGCGFCLTGKMGLVRNLTAGEIAGQARVLARETGMLDRPFNIVLMGMGEPLHNYDHTMKALRILHSEHGLSVSPRRVTLSTVGIVPGLQKRARPAESKIPAGRDSRDVPAVSAEEAEPHHVRVRDARRRQRHARGRAAARAAAVGNQIEGQSDSAQSRARHSVRASLG